MKFHGSQDSDEKVDHPK